MKKILLYIVVTAFSFGATAQPLKGRHTFEQMKETADAQFALNDFFSALTWYDKAFDEIKKEKNNPDKEEITYQSALCLLQLRDYTKAEVRLASILRQKENNIKGLEFLHAKVLKLNGKYDEAIPTLEKISKMSSDMAIRKEALRELDGARFGKAAQIQELLRIENGGTDVNTGGKETSAASAKAGEMFFISDRRNAVTELGGKVNVFSKIYSTQLQGNAWTNVKALDQVINRDGYHHFSVSLSPDGNTMYFTRGTLNGELVSESKAFMSKRERNGWGPANELKGAFTGKVMHPVVGELYGKEVLFFSSDMEGTKGGYDIYYANKKSDGTFDYPVNLGDVINTQGDEMTPYYLDGKLYFSSNMHPGMGGQDVFVSSWDGSAWSSPTNMGKGYNSSADDKSFTVDKEGNGFLASNRIGTGKLKGGVGQTCCDDIWLVIKDKVKANLVVTVLDAKKKPLNGSNIQIIEMTNNQMGNTSNQDNPTGNSFDSPLTLERSYMIIVSKDGYKPDTIRNINTVGLKKSTSITKEVTLKAAPKVKIEEYITVETNQPFELKNILYDYNKADIRPESDSSLNDLADLMVQYSDMVIELSAHTDARGRDAYNLDLSQRRANSVVKWLSERRGVSPDRLKPVGYGETQLKNSCGNGVECSEDDHQINRRTEFKILSGPTSIKVVKKERRPVTAPPKKN